MKNLIAFTLIFNFLASVHADVTKEFNSIVDEYFDELAKIRPTSATAWGWHQYDSNFEDLSKSGTETEKNFFKRFQKRIEKIDSKKLSLDEGIDYELLNNYTKGNLLELETVKMWQKNPDRYPGALSYSAFVIMSRNFAPPEERLKSLIARSKHFPNALKYGKENVKNPPKIYTEIAIQQIPGIIDFFKKDVPAAFNKVKDEALLKEFSEQNGKVIAALEDYKTHLEKTLLPKSKGDFRIGADSYKKKLLYEEMVDMPLEDLLKVGWANLKENQRAFQETAAKINKKKSAAEILAEMEKDHPPADKLLSSFKGTFGDLKKFLVNKKIVTLPTEREPVLQETPPFARALTFASMDTPGPFEKVAKEAFFNVTLAEKSWTPEQTSEHMAGFSWGVISSVAVHEAYPGHYIQFLLVPNLPSKTRKLLGAGTNSEGWAHYCEQMMIDEGFESGKLIFKLGMLQDALLRNARYIVGIKMHTGEMTYEEGIEFFQKEGYQSKANSERETKRGTQDPTYLMYTLGKLQIYKLREDYKKLKGNTYSLQDFHDKFLAQGVPPIRLVRRALLGSDTEKQLLPQ